MASLPTTGQGTLHRCAAFQEYNVGTNVQADYNTFATKIDLCWFGTGGGFLNGMMTANATLDPGPYAKGIMYQGGPVGGPAITPDFPEDWYTHDAKPFAFGNRVNSPAGNTIWIMNPRSTSNYTDTSGAAGPKGTVYKGFRDFHKHYLETRIKSNVHYTQSFGDSVGTQSMNSQIDPVTGVAWIQATWFNDLKDFFTNASTGVYTYLKARGYLFFPNGLVTNTQTYQYGDGAMLENAFRQPTDGTLASLGAALQTKWDTHGQRILDAQNAGKVALPLTQILSGSGLSPGAAINAWSEFVAAGAYILDLGKLFWDYNVLQNIKSDLGNAWVQNLKTPMDATAPKIIADFKLATGTGGNLYGRRYVRGFALLNTSSGQITYKLPRADYKRISGTNVGSNSIAVPAYSGIVLYATTDDPAAGGGGSGTAINYGNWTGSGIEGGGTVNSIAINPTNPNIVLGGGDVFGIALSKDGGKTWSGKQKIALTKTELQIASIEWHPDGVQAFAVAGNAGGSGALFYSKDTGATWIRVSTSIVVAGNQQGTGFGLVPSNHPRSTGKLIAVDATNGFIYVGTFNTGVKRFAIQPTSTNWGTGTVVGLAGEYIRGICIDDATPTTIYVSTFQGNISTQTGKARRITNANGGSPTVTQMNSPLNVEQMICLNGDLFACAMLHPSQNGGTDDATKRGVFRCASKSTSSAWTQITGPDYTTVVGGSASGTPSWKGIDGYVSGGTVTLVATSVAGYGDGAEGPRNGSGVYQPIWKGSSATGFASDNGTWTGLPTALADASETLPPSPPGHLWWHGSLDGNAGNDLGGKSGGVISSVSIDSGGRIVTTTWASDDSGATWHPAFGGWGQTTIRYIAVHPNVVGSCIAMNTDFKAFGTGETIGPKAGRYFNPGAVDHLTTPSVTGMTTGYVATWDEVTNAAYISLGNRDQYTQGALYYNPAPLTVDSSGAPTGANAWTLVTHPAGTSQIINGMVIITRSNGIRRMIAFVKPSTVGGTDGGIYYRDMSGGVLTSSWVAATTPSPLLDTQNTTLVPTAWRTSKPLIIYDRNSGVYRSSDEGATYTRILTDTSDIDAAGYVRWIPNTDAILVTNDTGVFRINNVSVTPTAPINVGSPSMKHSGDIRITTAGNIYCLQRSDPDGTLASCWATTIDILNNTAIALIDKWTEVGIGFDFSSGYPTNLAVDEGNGTGANEVVYVSSRGGGIITLSPTLTNGTVAPSIDTNPVIVNTPQEGTTLVCDDGTASGTPTPTATRQWKADGVAIGGETASSYTIPTGGSMVGKVITCTVTWSNGVAPTTSATSNSLGPITAASSAALFTANPVVSGTIQEGETVTCSTGSFTGTPTPTETYQWEVSDSGVAGTWSAIGGATANSFVIPTDYAGKWIRCHCHIANSIPSTDDAWATKKGPIAASIIVVVNPGPATVDIIYPSAGVVASKTQVVQVDAQHPYGIASVEVQLNGGAWQSATLNPDTGYWELAETLTLGINTISARATDNFPG